MMHFPRFGGWISKGSGVIRCGAVILLLALVLRAAPPAEVRERAPVEDFVERPVSVERLEDGRVFVDFGKAAFGWVELRLQRSAGGGELVVWLGEKADGRLVDRKPGGTIRSQEIRLQPAGARNLRVIPRWKPLYGNWIPTQEGMPEVAPFRYVEISGLADTPTAAEIVRHARRVPFDDAASAFSSSDPVLDEVWEFCKYSIKATTFAGLYVDGDRERVPYEADAYINQLCHYGVDAHYLTGRLTHEHLLRVPTWPMEWRQHSVLMAWVDYLYSGEAGSIREHYDVLVGRLMLDRRREDGLFVGANDGTPRDIIDWPAQERDGYDMKPRIKTVVTAFHAYSLDLMARMAEALDKPADAARFREMHGRTVAAMREKLMDPERGIYLDGLDDVSGVASSHASLHANLFPLAFGLVAPEHRETVVAFLRSRGMACSVYGAQFLLDGLYDAGEEDYAHSLLTATHDRSWVHMFRTVGSTISLEAWDAKYKPNLDWNHAWGAVPANTIPRKLMGIEPIEPGFRKFQVIPRLGPLRHASIRTPTPRGPVDLKVTREAGWEASLAVPAGTVAVVHVPVAEGGAVQVEKSPATRGAERRLGHRDGRELIEVPAGRWKFTSSAD